MRSVLKTAVAGAVLVSATMMLALSVNLAPFVERSVIQSGGELSFDSPKVIVDAGHGGVDGGAVSPIDKTVESGLNLQIALKLRDFLRIMGFRVEMTRETDISIHDESAKTIRQKKVSDIKNRLKLLEQGDAEFLVSIHMNIFSQSKYSGTQVFYGGQNHESSKLAECVQSNVKALLQPNNDRVVKQSTKSIYLLYNAKKPAVMAECGFLSNARELNMLKSDDYQRQMAIAVAKGVLDYKYGGSEQPKIQNYSQ